jgi:hypothetical protein
VALRFLVRRGWIAYVLCSPLVMLQFLEPPTGLRLLDWTSALLGTAVFLFVIARFGFFAVVVTAVVFLYLSSATLTNELSTWYSGQTIFAGLVLVALALAAAHFARVRTARAV